MDKTIQYETLTGKKRTWQIYTDGDFIVTVYGEEGGKMQTMRRKVKGKNLGRANETNAAEQAVKEAEAKYKLKYEQTCGAQLLPMLAQTYSGAHLEFPCLVQPKLNGVRGIYDPKSRKIYSRLGNEFLHLEHIISELVSAGVDLTLDGELYTDSIIFEEIVGVVKKKKYDARVLAVKYHVFDCIKLGVPFEKRAGLLSCLKGLQHSVIVRTEKCNREEDVEGLLDGEISAGYEGIILRNKKGIYQPNKRSFDLQKYKRFIDEEFIITAFERENNSDAIVWICETKEGREFAVKPTGTLAARSLSDRDAQAAVGHYLTVKYQELTALKRIPRFPVGVCIRNYE